MIKGIAIGAEGLEFNFQAYQIEQDNFTRADSNASLRQPAGIAFFFWRNQTNYKFFSEPLQVMNFSEWTDPDYS